MSTPFSSPRSFFAGGLLLGIGLGALVDGVVLHQLLQWHHMVSAQDEYPMTTLRGLQVNTHWDGAFNAGGVVVTIAGLALVWSARAKAGLHAGDALSGLLVAGWGLFNILDAVVNHYLLGLHHVRENTEQQWAYEVAYVVFSAVLVGVGYSLLRPWLDRLRRDDGVP